MDRLNFEGFLEFNQGIYDLVNKYNKIIQTSSQDGYENLLLNPELNKTIKTAGIGDEFNLAYFSLAGWFTDDNAKKQVVLSNFIATTGEPLDVVTDLDTLNKTKHFKLNLKSTSRNIYSKVNFQIQPNSSYIFAVEYYTQDVTLKDLVIEKASISNNGGFVDLTFGVIGYLLNPETNLYVSHLNKVLISDNKFLQYFVIRNEDLGRTANLREITFTLKGSANTNEYLMITKCNFFKGDLPLIGLVKQNTENLIKYENGKVKYFGTGDTENFFKNITSDKIVFIGETETYKTITEARTKEDGFSNKIIFLTSNIVEDIEELYLSNTIYGNGYAISYGREAMSIKIASDAIIQDIKLKKSNYNYTLPYIIFNGSNIVAKNITFECSDESLFAGSFFRFESCYHSNFENFNFLGLNNNLIEKAVLIDGCSNCNFSFGKIENIGKDITGTEYATGIYVNASNYNIIKLNQMSVSDLLQSTKIIKGVELVNSNNNDVKIDNIVEN
jgi:hypothetical protein